MDDLIEVTRDEFHAAIGAPLNVALRAEEDATYWGDKGPGRPLVGVTRPGYLESGLPWTKKRYYLVRRFVRPTKGGGEP